MTIQVPSPFTEAIAALNADQVGEQLLLVDVLASIVHPDMVCSLFALRSLDAPHRELARRCIEFAFSGRLTDAESAEIYRQVAPHLAARLNFPH
jgi:hypothetical protein